MPAPFAPSDQSPRFTAMIDELLASNRFYAAKLRGVDATWPPPLSELRSLPLTDKAELVADQQRSPPFGTNLTYGVERYTRVHQTSGTTGAPLRWLDDDASWQWWLACWRQVYAAAGVSASDRVFVAFSFGPFIGFWTAFEAAQSLGAMAISGGGLDTRSRVRQLVDLDATVVVATPTYALRLAEVAAELDIDLASSAVHTTVHAGEPGASLPNIRARLERAYGARVIDHVGATEVGAWGVSCGEADHVHVLEDEFIAEVVEPETGAVVSGEVERGELVLTNLGRVGSPIVRYRTGDLVELSRRGCGCGRDGAYLRGGVRARRDGMIVVRGINVFPSAIENLVAEFDEIDEFAVDVVRDREMSELRFRIEVTRADPETVRARLSERVHAQLQLRPIVELVEPMSLPRYELKSRRIQWSS